jgi:THO complex subunit 1
VLLEDVMDASAVQHCPHLFAWLEAASRRLRGPRLYGALKLAVLRLCNALLRRLSKGADALLAARILFFTAAFYPLNERSGVNLMVRVALSVEWSWVGVVRV